MKAVSIGIAGLVLLGTTHQTTAQTTPAPAERVTVSSLINQGYDLVSTIAPASGGSGLFLRKGTRLYFCFVSETPQSATVMTRYCKPVE
jgi:hypothetical protein